MLLQNDWGQLSTSWRKIDNKNGSLNSILPFLHEVQEILVDLPFPVNPND